MFGIGGFEILLLLVVVVALVFAAFIVGRRSR